MGNVIFGLAVVVVVVVRIVVVVVIGGAGVGGSAVPEDMDEEIDGRGLGTVRLEHASIITGQPRNSSSIMPILYLSNTLQLVLVGIVLVVVVECIFVLQFRFLV